MRGEHIDKIFAQLLAIYELNEAMVPPHAVRELKKLFLNSIMVYINHVANLERELYEGTISEEMYESAMSLILTEIVDNQELLDEETQDPNETTNFLTQLPFRTNN